MQASIFVKLQRVDIEAMRTVIEKLLREFLETKRLPLTRRPSDPKLSAVEFHENLSELSYSNDSGFYCATALPERKTKRPSPKRPLSVHANRVSDRSESFRIIIQLNKAYNSPSIINGILIYQLFAPTSRIIPISFRWI
jgi:hypothetical protein